MRQIPRLCIFSSKSRRRRKEWGVDKPEQREPVRLKDPDDPFQKNGCSRRGRCLSTKPWISILWSPFFCYSSSDISGCAKNRNYYRTAVYQTHFIQRDGWMNLRRPWGESAPTCEFSWVSSSRLCQGWCLYNPPTVDACFPVVKLVKLMFCHLRCSFPFLLDNSVKSSVGVIFVLLRGEYFFWFGIPAGQNFQFGGVVLHQNVKFLWIQLMWMTQFKILCDISLTWIYFCS